MDYFFYPHTPKPSEIINFEPAEAKHFRALRKKSQDKIILANGQGLLSQAQILSLSKTHFQAQILTQNQLPHLHQKILAIANLQARDRLEWLAEKAVEIGIKALIILQTQYCQTRTLRAERLQKIMLAAMLQSQQAYLPQLITDCSLTQVLAKYPDNPKYLAHCNPNFARSPLENPSSQALFLIGPEGDFSAQEIEFLQGHCQSISLCEQRLRAETAALMALCK